MAKAAKKAAPVETKAPKKAASKKAAPEAAPKKEAPKAAAKKAAPKKAAAKKGGKTGGQANPAFMAPLKVSADLAKIVGAAPLPRTEIIKKMWEYIKANNLQDPNDKRRIVADKNLKVVFGGEESVSMFQLAKVVNDHVS